MRKTDSQQQLLKEFAEFVEADPLAPPTGLDKTLLGMVAKDLRPARWKVFTKLTVVEVAAGLVTLTICPQFGLGFGQHNAFVHNLHLALPSAVFYLFCGLFFVSLGAILCGLALTRADTRRIGNGSYAYFFVYSLMAYLVLISLGTEAFVAGSIFWIAGALLGNVLGFEAVVRLRQARSW